MSVSDSPNTLTNSLVEVRDLKLHFPVRNATVWPWQETPVVRAVDGISFAVGPNEIYGLAGESGCGKSTVARVLMGLIEATDGTVFFRGRPIGDYASSELRPQMQMVFQDPYTSLNPRRIIGNIVGDPLAVHTRLSGAERRKKVIHALERTGLAHYHYFRYPHEFSGGQRQRAAIARALILDPDFLVLDEPTSALDVSVQAVILNLIRELQHEMQLGCLFITHDLNLMRFLVDRVGVMYLGRIVETGATEEIFSNPLHPYTKALIAATPQPNPDRPNIQIPLEGELPSNINPPPGCPFHPRCPDRIAGLCDRIVPSLKPHVSRELACHLYHPADDTRETRKPVADPADESTGVNP